MNKPRLLDLFCGAGGCAEGYSRAGFDVVGVDIVPHPRYPFPFILGDALDVLGRMLSGERFLASDGNFYGIDDFVMIHASPPCQGYSLLSFIPNRNMSNYPRLISPIREMLIKSKLFYIIENVPRAPLLNPLILCGTMFGLRVHKHRAFETCPPIYFCPAGCNKARVKPKGSGKKLGQYYSDGERMVSAVGHQFSARSGGRAMNINWMTRDELAEACPPAYTQYIGSVFIRSLFSSGEP